MGYHNSCTYGTPPNGSSVQPGHTRERARGLSTRDSLSRTPLYPYAAKAKVLALIFMSTNLLGSTALVARVTLGFLALMPLA